MRRGERFIKVTLPGNHTYSVIVGKQTDQITNATMVLYGFCTFTTHLSLFVLEPLLGVVLKFLEVFLHAPPLIIHLVEVVLQFTLQMKEEVIRIRQLSNLL